MVADYVVEIQSFEPLEKQPMLLLEETIEWTLNTDGATKKFGVGIGVVLVSIIGIIM